ncbi:formate--tetrahydrofolate ligase, partial [Parolsenella catena]
MSDIEIAQQAELWPIAKVADTLGITDDELIPYGRHMAKVDVTRLADRPRKAKVVLVTAINPTPAGEGKTTTS